MKEPMMQGKEIYHGPITKEYIKTFLPENPIIVEAGAHIGRDTLKMSFIWPQAIIYAFEPVPELYAQLVERTKNQRNVICDPRALSNGNGSATLHVSTGASTAASSLLEPYEYRTQRPEVLFHPTTVSTITLDSWSIERGIKAVDFLWLDTQGTELTVLQAAPQIIKTVKALLIEVNLTERFKGNPDYETVKHWIESHGFALRAQDIPKHNKVNLFFTH